MAIDYRRSLDQLKPYTPGKSIAEIQADRGLSDVIKMASNENPLGCPVSADELRSVVENAVYYPHPPSEPLLDRLPAKLGISVDQLMVGNGSDDVILMLTLGYLNPGDEVITSETTFSEYAFATYLLDGRLSRVPLKDYAYDVHAMQALIGPKTKMLFIASPNNPTGTIVPKADLKWLLDNIPPTVLCVIDEAYGDYVDDPDYPDTVAMLADYPNLVILRTFSKLYGLAGFRIGYGIAHPDIVAVLHKVRQPFNVNSLGMAAANLALQKTDFIAQSLQVNRDGKAQITAALDQLGLRYILSQANFVSFFVPGACEPVVESLLDAGIITRPLTSFGLPDGIRVTIGLPAHNDRFIQALTNAVTPT